MYFINIMLWFNDINKKKILKAFLEIRKKNKIISLVISAKRKFF